MFTKIVNKFSRNFKLKAIPFLFLLILITPANSDPITENQVDDLNLVISQFVGGAPNALFIMDVSGSMGRNYGGSQVGDWTLDQDDGVLVECEQSFCGNSCNSFEERAEAAHCAENAANVSECGSKICSRGAAGGTCTTVEQLQELIDCVGNNINPPQLNHIIDIWCGDADGNADENIIDDCGDFNGFLRDGDEPDGIDEIEGAAAAIEAQAGLTQCASLHCSDFASDPLGLDDPACDLPGEYDAFRTCMLNRQAITINQAENCTATSIDELGNEILVNENCEGQPAYGSSRLDVTLSVIFDLLDADDSIDDTLCTDDGNSNTDNPTNNLFDGTSPISCGDYMNTPFRNVRQIVRDDGSPASRRTLPISGSGDNKLINYLTNNDADELNIRLRPLTYSGEGHFASCTANSTFQVPQGGFAGGSDTAFKNVWRFFRRLEPGGGTPLALSLGFDDNNGNGGGGGNVINDDALGVFRVELQTDQAVECRPEFIIVLTDGEDTCSGECDVSSSSCSGSFTTNANRRSVIQAASNARTYYSRNPFNNQGNQFKKEILTFVIGLGIPEENAEARRTLNAAALAGGTSTQGIIQHIDPAGNSIGLVDINTLLPGGAGLNVFKNLAKAQGIDTNPTSAHLQSCLTPDESGHCHFQGNNIFDNAFFNTGAPLPAGGNNLMDGFAFFPQNAVELTTALETIFGFIDAQTSAGVAPGAPQSSTSVALRDRIFLSLLTPITQARVWQGRLGLYGFVDDLSNPGNKIVVTKPPTGTDFTDPAVNATLADNFGIFDQTDGTLIDSRTQMFHWEGAKLLTERDLSSNPRRAFTVDINFSDQNIVNTSQDGVIRYLGDRTEFDNTLEPEIFGISDADVFDPIPLFCQDDTDGFADCNAGTNDCDEDIAGTDCQTCVQECIRDRVVDFMLGNTDILPEGDPMGGPEIVGTSNVGETIGINCPDPNDVNPGGSFSQCSVRLGDIFHSDPIVVGSPSALFFDVGFPVFAQSYRDRSSAVYVGANDGGFHSFHAGELIEASQESPQRNPFTGADSQISFFDEGTGWEMFYYIPPTFLPDSIAPISPINKEPESHLVDTFSTIAFAPDYRFGDLKSFVMDNLVQRSFFDGSPLIFDAWIDGFDNGINDNSIVCPLTTGPAVADGLINECGKEWHSVMIAGYRNGGGAYTALDITNPKCNETGGICSTVDKFADSVSDGRFDGPGQEYPKHLWTVFDRDFGNTWSNPTRGRVRMKTQDGTDEIIADRWLVFVGGGIDPIDIDPSDNASDPDNFGNAFYAIDVTTGQIVYKFHPTRTIPLSVDTIPNNGNIQDSMVCEMGSEIGIFDINVDGYVDLAYGGDTCGRLWRFDISQPITDTGNNVGNTGRTESSVGSASIEAQDWTASIAFCANEDSECGTTDNPSIPQNNITPIYFAPTTAIDVAGRRHVIFTTGSRRDPSSITEFGKLYNFIDNFIPSFLAGGIGGTAVSTPMLTDDDFSSSEIIQLVEQTGVGDTTQFTTTGGEGIGNQGEFIVQFPDNETSINGEKGIGTPVVINRVLIFTSFAPDAGLEANPCENKAGEGRVFALDFVTGDPALSRIPGADSLIEGSDSEQLDVAGLTVAEGIPSPARLTFGAQGSVLMTVAFSGGPSVGGAQFLVWELPPFPSRTQTLFWEEII